MCCAATTSRIPARSIDCSKYAPGIFEEAFWLCGAHAGFRLSGEALCLKWGTVDFKALVLRPYDNWVLGQLDTTKTSDCEAIPMTPGWLAP